MGRLHDLEMPDRPDERERSRNEGTLAVTRKWSALLKLLVVDGPRISNRYASYAPLRRSASAIRALSPMS